MIREIYLVHHTHMDIGYTDLPLEVLDQHLANMDTVLELCEKNAVLPPEQQYRWTCESAILVRDYLRHRPSLHANRLLHALREGWVELQACLTQPLTELASGEELIRCIGYAAELGKKERFPVECAIIDDIAGYAGRLPTVFAGWGIRYLVAGAGSFQVHLPWADLPKLFYLEDKAGARVLMWNPGISKSIPPQQMPVLDGPYCMGATYLVFPFLEEEKGESRLGAEPDIQQRLSESTDYPRSMDILQERYEREGYPYEEVMLQYAIDNCGPDPALVDIVRRINASGRYPRVRLTTPGHFLRHMEQQYGDRIPVIRGVMTDPWNIRANPVPRFLKEFRKAQRTLSTAETRTVFQPGQSPEGRAFEEVYENLHLCSDHTFGLSEWAWPGMFDPRLGCRAGVYDRYRRSWAYKHHYAEAAMRQADGLDRLARQRLGADIYSTAPCVLVWNDTPYPQSGPAELYLGRDKNGLVDLTDEVTGERVPVQCIGQNRYLIMSGEVPGFGYRRLNPTFADKPGLPSGNAPAPGATLESDFLTVSLDRKTGRVTSVRGKAEGTEYLDTEGGLGLGDFVYHRIEGLSLGPQQSGMCRDVRLDHLPVIFDGILPGMSGSVADSVIVREHVDGPAGLIRVEREITLYKHAPRVDVRVRLDKPETEKKEACYVAFPLAGKSGDFTFDQNIGSVTPGRDLMTAAMQDAFFCFSRIDLRDDGWRVSLACPDAPVFQFGRIRTCSWEDELPFVAGSNHLYAWLYHNLLNTDDPVWQDVLNDFRFGLIFHEKGAPETAVLVESVGKPLQAEVRAVNPLGALKAPVGSFMELNPTSTRLISARELRPGRLQIRLEETTGENQPVRLTLRLPILRARVVDFFGKPLSDIPITNAGRVEFDIQPNALVTLQLEYE